MGSVVDVFHPTDGATPALSGVYVFREDESKGDIVFKLTQFIPLNEFSLPIFFLRSDMLHGTSITDEDVDAASVGLFYHDGFPCLENGATFWNQLPHEPHASFLLFQAYLDQAADIGIRQLDLLATSERIELGILTEMHREFYWGARARAYDLFIVAAEAKKRQHRIRKMEDGHYGAADNLFTKLLGRFSGENEDWIDELNAKEAIEVLSELVKIQRLSVGLTGQHASSTSRDIGPGESAESVIRKIAQGGGMNQSGSDKFAATLQQLLENPEEGAILQAAVIKVTAPNNRGTFDEDM